MSDEAKRGWWVGVAKGRCQMKQREEEDRERKEGR